MQWNSGAVPGRLRHRVVQREPGAEIPTLPTPMLEGVEELHRLDQMRGQLLQHEPTFGQGLGHQAEVEHLQVAQASVDQLAGPARRAGREVTCFDQSDPQTAGGRVECRTGADDAAADDQDVQGLRRHVLQGGFAVDR